MLKNHCDIGKCEIENNVGFRFPRRGLNVDPTLLLRLCPLAVYMITPDFDAFLKAVR